MAACHGQSRHAIVQVAPLDQVNAFGGKAHPCLPGAGLRSVWYQPRHDRTTAPAC